MVGQIYRTRMRQDAPDWKPGQFLAVSVFLGAVLASHNLFAADESQPEHEPSRSQVLEARRKEKAEHLEPYEVTAVEEKIGNYEKRPWFSKLTVKGFRGLRLELGGLSRESGFAFGAGYLAGADRPVNIHARALYSTTGDSQVDTRLGFFESDESRFSLNLKACSSDLNQLTFYGIGPESEPDSKQDFGLSSRILSFETRYEFMPHLELKAGIGQADFRPTALPNSPETLAAAIQSALRKRSALAQVSRVALERVEGFYWETIGKPAIVWYDGGHYAIKNHVFEVLRRIGDHFVR